MAKAPEWDERAFQEWYRDPNGPVLRDLLPGIGRDVTALARATYHRRTGATADSLRYETATDSQGPYVRVGGSYVINFLEHPAEQMRRPYRWLSDAARAVLAR